MSAQSCFKRPNSRSTEARPLNQSSCPPAGIVLDPFCGCGTTVAAAHQLQREWIGIDISPQAVEIIRQRLNRIGVIPTIYGLPTNVDDLRRLGPFDFQRWIIQRVMANPSPRLTGDMGVDGYSFFERLPIQVKQSERVGREVLDQFESAIRSEGKHKGYVVAFSFTRGAVEAAARVRRRRGIEMVLVKVEDVVRVGDLIDDADRDGRPPDLRDVTPDLMQLFSALQQRAEDRPPPSVPADPEKPSAQELIQSARRRKPRQLDLTGVSRADS